MGRFFDVEDQPWSDVLAERGSADNPEKYRETENLYDWRESLYNWRELL